MINSGDEGDRDDHLGQRAINIKDPFEGKDLNELRALALEGELVGARKLTFAAQCGAFAALYSGVRNQVVARAFGLSVQAVSYLSGCLESDPEPRKTITTFRDGEMVQETSFRDHNRNRSPNRIRRYVEVGREFEALGEEEFARRYYTARVVKRILAAKEELKAKR